MRLTSHDLRDLQILKYYRLVRKWACKTYGLTDADLELLIYLDCKGRFTRQEFIDLTITAGYTKEVTRAIVEKINQFPHSDGVIVLADMSTTTLADATVAADVVPPQITAVNAITVAAAFS